MYRLPPRPLLDLLRWHAGASESSRLGRFDSPARILAFPRHRSPWVRYQCLIQGAQLQPYGEPHFNRAIEWSPALLAAFRPFYRLSSCSISAAKLTQRIALATAIVSRSSAQISHLNS